MTIFLRLFLISLFLTGSVTGARAQAAASGRLTQAAEDSAAIQKHLAQNAKDAQVMEDAIRALLTENDDLYVVASKRSREVAELRSKFEGTPYSAAYLEAIKGLPIERVPQHPWRADNYIAGLKNPVSTSAAVEIPATRTQHIVAAIPEAVLQTPIPESQAATLADMIEAENKLLKNKMDLLDKKEAELDSLKTQLTATNTDLKAVNTHYTEAINQITATPAPVVNDDLTAKLRELQTLHEAIQVRDAATVSLKTTLVENTKNLNDINAQLAEKDQKINELGALLNILKLDNDRQVQVINSKNTDLAYVDHAISDVRSQVGGIESLLNESNSDLTALSKDITRVKAIIDEHKAVSQRKDIALDVTKSGYLNDVERVKDLESALQAKAASLEEANRLIETLNKELRAIHGTAEDRQKFLNALEAKTKSLQATAGEKNSELELERARLAEISKQAEHLERESVSLKSVLAEKDIRLEETRQRLTWTEKEAAEKDKTLRANADDLLALEEKTAAQEKTILALKTALNATGGSVPAAIAAPRKELSAASAAVPLAANANTNEIAALTESLRQSKEENHQLSFMLDAYKKQAAEKAAIQEQALQNIRSKDKNTSTLVQCAQLDVEERNVRIEALQKDLDVKNKSLEEASSAIALLQEKLSALDIKQEAIREIIHSRNTDIAKMNTEILAMREELKLAGITNKELQAKAADAQNMSGYAEKTLTARERETAALRTEIENLRASLKTAREFASLKTSKSDEFNAEIKRLKDALDVKEKEIADLQARLKLR
ncbi:MAG: hypothetical protein HQL19_04240 [Candidatus Omnitrophica bacterium]|nr:hypothetical protein [Candidatus Omnitrophota bacterium]